MLSIYTASEGDVRLRIEVVDAPAPIDESQWLHIAEGSVRLPSGRLVVASPESHFPDCDRLHIAPGTYQTRVAGRWSESEASEEYLVTLWPGPDRDVAVIKWAGPYAA
jgi:hypothetical protein